MNILVTGGAGFIGSHICTRLIELGHTVRCIDSMYSGKYENIVNLVDSIRFSHHEMDINDVTVEFLKRYQIDAISHQAAIGSVPKSILHPELYQLNNVSGFFNVLNAAKEAGIKRIVYASSSSVYGSDVNLPKVEHITGQVLSPYAATKQINEIQANTYYRVYDMETIGLRYFNVFGPKQNPNGDYAAVIPKFINSILNSIPPTINGDGTFSRDFTYVDNVVDANVLALTTENEACFGQAFNIGAGRTTSILELFNLIKSQLGSAYTVEAEFGPFRKGDIPNSVASIHKATINLGYNPKIDIELGLTKTISYYNENINNTTN